ncbi:hypothetical protein M3Y97_00122500 [Aphelenchoides bicaudatus]|nr:hypothetical protein M3Y97_00122500 [Aphelenchoides bicaudatus]
MIPIGETRDGRADMTNFEMDLLDTRVHNYPPDQKDGDSCCQNSIVKPACLPITIVAILLMITFLMPIFNDDLEMTMAFEKTGVCSENCLLKVVESIPTNLTYDSGPKNEKTHEAWLDLLRSAEKSIRIASFYWTLRDSSGYPTSVEGQKVFDELVNAGKRGVRIQIVQNKPSKAFPQTDSAELAEQKLAEVRSIDFFKLFGSGVLHTKFMIIDEKHVYVGSANMDWRSLTEVKELGVVLQNCSCMAIDLQKIFVVYWRVAENSALIPEPWPLNLRTKFNHEHPLNISYNGQLMQSFISVSFYLQVRLVLPQQFNAKGRDHDLTAIEYVIGQAKEYVRVAVMDYIPSTLYMGVEKNYYWGHLDTALRAAAFRGVRVDLLISQWNYSRPEMLGYLKSMLEINSVLPLHAGGRRGQTNVKLFTVPSSQAQKQIDHGRVNHNKYMVTDRAAYPTTSSQRPALASYFKRLSHQRLSIISMMFLSVIGALRMQVFCAEIIEWTAFGLKHCFDIEIIHSSLLNWGIRKYHFYYGYQLCA